ncbi:hypothetical protein AYI88_20385 [Shewanella algae]|nr:hypothetical protein AYI88_20385 [Shewanella algae]
MSACDMKLHHGELKYMTAMKVMLAGSEINPSLLKPRVPLDDTGRVKSLCSRDWINLTRQLIKLVLVVWR